MNTSLRRLALVLALCLAGFAAAPVRAETLAELLEQVGLGAVIGTWIDEDTKGEKVSLTYAWKVADHALSISVKSPGGNSEGMIAYDPESQEVVHVTVDEKGRMTKGKWSERDGLAVLDLTRFDPAGDPVKLRITHKIIDNRALVVGMKNPETDEGGEITLVRKPE